MIIIILMIYVIILHWSVLYLSEFDTVVTVGYTLLFIKLEFEYYNIFTNM